MKVNILIKPNSTKGPLVELQPDGSLTVYVKEVAIENKANEALIKVLSKYYNKPKSNIKIVRGFTGRNKIIEIV
jgi:uncharacterized protein YggU (UPF0235/DUF167 family)